MSRAEQFNAVSAATRSLERPETLERLSGRGGFDTDRDKRTFLDSSYSFEQPPVLPGKTDAVIGSTISFARTQRPERWRLAGWPGGVSPPNRQTLDVRW